jgi:hypothetical protein
MKVDDLIPSEFASASEMCKALAVTKAAISQWRKNGIPELRQYQIREVLRKRSTADQAA